MADRIQRQRARGWRLPDGAVCVDRTSRWGNPYTTAGAIENGYALDSHDAPKVAVEFFRSWLLGLEPGENDTYRVGSRTYDRLWMREHLPELTGKTLACFCPPGQPCHGDVLLRIASGEDEAGRVLMIMLHQDKLPWRW